MKKAIGLVMALVMTVSTLTACGNGTTDDAKTSEKEVSTDDMEIVVVPKDATIPWFLRMEEGVDLYAEETGINAYQKGPASCDAAEQIEIIDDLIAQGVDAICVVPVDPAALEAVLKKAMDAGIVVITTEGSSQENTMYNVEAFDNASYGAALMEALAKSMNYEGTYTTMVGSLTNASHNDWADAAVAYQQENYPDMQLLEAEPRIECLDDASVTYDKTKEVLKAHPEVTGILGTSGHVLQNAPTAIEELGLVGTVWTTGSGLPSQCYDFITNGIGVETLVMWDPLDSGYVMCELARKILAGEEVKDGIDLGRTGYNSVKVDGNQIKGEGFIVVTKDNIDEYDF